MNKVPYGQSEAKIQAKIRRDIIGKHICCPKCRKRYTRIVDNRYWCGKCRYKFSLKTILPFKGSRLPLNMLWGLLHCWLVPLSITQAMQITGLSEVTIRRWYRRLSGLLPEDKLLLQGIVEVDEAFIGKKSHQNQQIVIGGLERHTGRIILKCIPDRETASTDRFLLDHITTDSMVFTDSHASYFHITEFFGFGHEWINHSAGQYGITNRIENTWMRLRRFIRKTVSRAWKEHLPRIIKEFQYRNNYKQAFTSPASFLRFVFQVS